MPFTLSFPLPSLQRIACIQLSIALWKNNYTWKTDWPINGNDEHLEWNKLEANICAEMEKLPITDSLKHELRTEFIYNIGEELREWITTLDPYLWFNHRTLKIVCDQTRWTLHGKIDEKATLNSMLQCDKLSLRFKFDLSSLFCLEDVVRDLWLQLPDDEKLPDDVEDNFSMVSFWKSVVSEDTDVRQMSLDRKLDEYCLDAADGGVSAAEYFFNACPGEEVGFVMGVIRNGDIRIDVWFYLLSRLSEWQLGIVFLSRESVVFPSVAASDWVYADFLEDMFDRTHRFFKGKDFLKLLAVITNRKRSCDAFRRCFDFVWRNCRPELKDFILCNSYEMYYLVKRLFRVESLENIRLCLGDVRVEGREEFVKDFADNEERYGYLDLVSVVKEVFRTN